MGATRFGGAGGTVAHRDGGVLVERGAAARSSSSRGGSEAGLDRVHAIAGGLGGGPEVSDRGPRPRGAEPPVQRVRENDQRQPAVADEPLDAVPFVDLEIRRGPRGRRATARGEGASRGGRGHRVGELERDAGPLDGRRVHPGHPERGRQAEAIERGAISGRSRTAARAAGSRAAWTAGTGATRRSARHPWPAAVPGGRRRRPALESRQPRGAPFGARRSPSSVIATSRRPTASWIGRSRWSASASSSDGTPRPWSSPASPDHGCLGGRRHLAQVVEDQALVRPEVDEEPAVPDLADGAKQFEPRRAVAERAASHPLDRRARARRRAGRGASSSCRRRP